MIYLFQPENGELNTFFDKRVTKFITELETNDLNEAFKMSQNDINEDYAKLGHRSSSVGDVLIHNDKQYFIKGVGFELINK